MDNYWQNKMKIGRGILEVFREDYDHINSQEGQFATASQLYPTGEKVEGCLVYEYVIYYKVKPKEEQQPKTPIKQEQKKEMRI